MTSKEIMNDILDKQGTSKVQLGARLGMSRQHIQCYLGDKVKTAYGIRSDMLCQILRAMDYKVVIVPSNVKCKDGWYEMDDSEGVGNAEK